MSTLLLGDDGTVTFTGHSALGVGDVWAARYSALSDGTITSIQVHSDRTYGETDPVTIELGVYTDDSGAPGSLLGSATVASHTIVGWIEATGLSVDITAGTHYWLSVDSTDGYLDVSTTFESGDTTVPWWPSDLSYSGGLPDPWGGTTGYTLADAEKAVGLRAFGDAIVVEPPTPVATGLEFHLTGLWLPGATSVPYYGRIADPSAGEVVIPLNDGRTASVTLSSYDPIIEGLAALAQIPYAVMLKAYYRGALVFWGPVKVHAVDSASSTTRLDAVDMSLRFTNHYLRRGDLLSGFGELTFDDQDQGYLTINGAGVRLVRNAVNTTSFPTLGVGDGVDSFTAAAGVVGVTRGDQAWQKVTDVQSALGPDVELAPDESTPQQYATLNTVVRQGSDQSAIVVFHYGTGRQNVESLQFTEGEEYCNMVHVLDRDHKFRVTVVNSTALARTGPYVRWEATDFDATNSASDADVKAVLQAYGEAIIAGYGQPSLAVSITLPVDTEDSYHYIDDFIVGDSVGIAGKIGFETIPDFPYRLMRVTLSLDGEGVRTALDVVADRSAGNTIDTTDPEDT